MVLIRVVLALHLTLVSPAFADSIMVTVNSGLKRTEYKNRTLIEAVNKNRLWYYAAFAWNGPSHTLRQIREKAEKNQWQAQELLLLLSQTLSKEKPAGPYVSQLYRDLLEFSQVEGAMPVNVLIQLLKDRSWDQEQPFSIPFTSSDAVSAHLVSFFKNKLKLPSLESDRYGNQALVQFLTSLYIENGINVSNNHLPQLVNFTVRQSNPSFQAAMVQRIFEIENGERFFNKKTLEKTAELEEFLEARSTLIETMPVESQKALLIEGINSLEFHSEGFDSIFNFKKVESDIYKLDDLGGERALRSVSQQLESLVSVAESFDQHLSDQMVRIAVGLGFEPKESLRMMKLSYSKSQDESESSKVIDFFQTIELQKYTIEDTKILLETVLEICQMAILKNDKRVLRSCANDLYSRLNLLSNRTKAFSDIRKALANAASQVLHLTSRYFDPSQFITNCFEVDLPGALEDLQSQLKELVGMRMRIPEDYVFRDQATFEPVGGIKYFTFVDCRDVEVEKQMSSRPYLHVLYGGEELLKNVFQTESNTVASCIAPQHRQVLRVLHDITRSREKVTEQSQKIISFFREVQSRFEHTIGFGLTQVEDFELSPEEDQISKYFDAPMDFSVTGNLRHGRLSLEERDYYSGKIMPAHFKSICIQAKENEQKAIHCNRQGAKVTCRDHSLFYVSIAPKG